MSRDCTCLSDWCRSRCAFSGFSYVDLVKNTNTREQFALKRIVCHSESDERDALMEIEMSNRFCHDNIIHVVDHMVIKCGAKAGSSVVSEVLVLLPFYKMGTIQDVIDRAAVKLEHIPEDRILRLFKGICEGVKEMHSASPEPIAHRDLKPSNVLLTNDGVSVLMDFGSAAPGRVNIQNASQAMTLQDTAAERCTMPFRAPELFDVQNDAAIDERTDIWSLGCLLYSMAYLQSPFDDAYQKGGSIALAAKSRNFKYPPDLIYSNELKNLIDFMLSVDPQQRPTIDQVLLKLDVTQNTVQGRI